MIKSSVVAIAATLLASVGVVSAGPSLYQPASSGLPNGYNWKFIGCRSTNTDIIAACTAATGDSYTANLVTTELNGNQPDRSQCGGSAPYASWCGIFNPGVSDPRCIRSCADNGAYIIVGTYWDGYACLGDRSDRCTWFEDSSCSILKPLAQPITTVATAISCPVGGTTGWCGEANKVFAGAAPTDCGLPVPPPPPPVVADQCTAPKGGPDYGGSKWTCVQDSWGADSFVPVKLTAWQNAGCLSRNSRDCVWSNKECCENLAATADGSTPYFECGPLHAAVWGASGYEDPRGWCTLAMNALGGTAPPPPPSPPSAGIQGCSRYIETGCVGGRYSTVTLDALGACKTATSVTPVAFLSYTYLGQDGCGAYGGRLGVQCLFTDSSCSGSRPVSVSTVRAPAGDEGCRLFGSPNSQPNIATACVDICKVSVSEGRGFADYECKGSELSCTCTAYA